MIGERNVQVGDVSIHLRTWGDEGMPVVFWHALGDHSSMQMAEAGPILVNEYGMRVVGIDAPASVAQLPDCLTPDTKSRLATEAAVTVSRQ